jgi:hypothetical protein
MKRLIALKRGLAKREAWQKERLGKTVDDLKFLVDMVNETGAFNTPNAQRSL